MSFVCVWIHWHLRADPEQTGKGTGKGHIKGKRSDKNDDGATQEDAANKERNRRKGRGATVLPLLVSHAPRSAHQGFRVQTFAIFVIFAVSPLGAIVGCGLQSVVVVC